MTEVDFITKINNGDLKAFEDVFKSNYANLVLFANKFLNDVNVSEEIVSESLTFLWEKRETLAFTSSVTGYLYKMVQNRSLNYLKHQKIENDYVGYLIRNKLIDEVPEHPTDPYLEKEMAQQIKIAIDTLPEKCRQVFVMSRFEYLKNREIAERLNISQKTVERQITIALDKLKKSLEYILGAVLVCFL
ncbi:RNA polymerase sigma-70 factor [Daejeonella lutea]|uniref:RNA polymerase sigma-70 factor, ECF subfamily n=1 Tax=Daejeonella lutea TaxID=572036 RepID=A0A1T5ABE8_9SPHI|nr:RNA polymerase sigma-70 factor [Daejeonella lutea]SKB32003.1 RNA polymerase sigma-70 factor, ECF subfamily [Daejeonella lutea]